MLKEKLNAIINFVNEDIENINIIDENTIEIDGAEYKVLTDEEADEEYYNYQLSLLDDLGINSFTDWAKDYILNNFIDVEWFNQAMEESYQFYIDDIKEESNRLEEEMEDAGVETEDEFLNYLCDQWENGIEWYRDNFGDEDFATIVKENNLINNDEVIEWTKREDGRGCLASYDGEEVEQDNYFIYRTN